MDFPFALEDYNNDLDLDNEINYYFTDDSSDSTDIDYNKFYNYYDKCQICNNFNYLIFIKINLNRCLYLCQKCKVSEINYQFKKKLNKINKYLILTSIKERRKLNEIKFYFIHKMNDCHRNSFIVNIFEDLKEMDNFIHELKNIMIYHPGYPVISTFISLLKKI